MDKRQAIENAVKGISDEKAEIIIKILKTYLSLPKEKRDDFVKYAKENKQ